MLIRDSGYEIRVTSSEFRVPNFTKDIIYSPAYDI